jgi:hypothetical protein
MQDLKWRALIESVHHITLEQTQLQHMARVKKALLWCHAFGCLPIQ